ncbi:MAG: hypothetical protein PHI87_06855 [Candidatus Methanomethylophilus sp.]|jgi:hypothetical protein|nr:hypothetical protein [Methanomethylophilus sp.]
MIKDNKNLEIKFGGDLHEIDVDLLIESLVSYSSVTQEVSAYLSPGTKIDIKIKAPKEGSFIILLNMIAQNASDIFINTKEGVYLASDIVTLVGGLYCLKKWISKNGKPETIKQKEGNSIEISNNNGNIIISNDVYNIYQENPKVRDNLRNTFIKLKEKDQIKDFCIRDIDNNKEIFKVDKKDFSLLASSEDEINVRKQKVIKENQELSVFKVVFRENYKWEFFFQGVKIYASVKDDFFFKKIEKGEIAFRSGDRLSVDLEIEQIFNEAANTFVNDSYNIIKVIDHKPRSSYSQGSMDFEN